MRRWYPVVAESEVELQNLLMRVKEENEKADLKLNLQKTKIMASSPITSWQIDGENVETVTDLILGGSKIITHSDNSHKSNKRWLLGRNTDKLRQHIKKLRRYYAHRGSSSQSYGFSSGNVRMWELEP